MFTNKDMIFESLNVAKENGYDFTNTKVDEVVNDLYDYDSFAPEISKEELTQLVILWQKAQIWKEHLKYFS